MEFEERLSVDRARRSAGAAVSIEKVDGGFILRWREAVVIPQAKRNADGDDHELVNRSAVREKLDAALDLLRVVLESDKVTDRKWE